MADAISSATSGLLAATQRFDQSAARIARIGTDLAGAADPTEAVVALLDAKNSVAINAAVIRSAADTQKSLLDILV